MTKQLDPTILRFFTVSRIISPVSEMRLCKFHIEIEYFLTRRHPPCAQTLSALRFLPRHCSITPQTHHKPTTITHFTPPSSTTPQTYFQKPAFHGLAYLRPHFRDFATPSKPTQKPAFPHMFLTPFCFVYFTTVWCHPNPHPHYRFPLFAIFFFLFTYMSMFCPIF